MSTPPSSFTILSTPASTADWSETSAEIRKCFATEFADFGRGGFRGPLLPSKAECDVGAGLAERDGTRPADTARSTVTNAILPVRSGPGTWGMVV